MNQADRYTELHSMEEAPLLKALREETGRKLEYDDMLCGPVVGSFLQLLLRMISARTVLEIGTFTGYSALHMAMALPADGKVVTCEANEKYAGIARPFFKRYQEETGGAEIELRMGDAIEILKKETVPAPDLIFLDADKDRYPEYYDLLIPLLNPGGILVVDNAFWKGGVWGDESGFRERSVESDKRRAASVHLMNRKASSDIRVEQVLLPIRDGIHLIRKKTDG